MKERVIYSDDVTPGQKMKTSLKIFCASSVIILIIITSYLFIESETFMPSCAACDVAGYWMVAQHYSLYGLFGPMHGYANIRTYVFPGLLSLLLGISEMIHANPRALLAGAQVIAFVSSCWMLARAAGRYPTTHALLFIVALLNPFVVPYLVFGLADSTALIAFQFWLALMLLHWRHIRRHREQPPIVGSFWLIIAAFVAGLAMEIRPAYVWLPPVTLLCSLWLPTSPLSSQLTKRLVVFLMCVIATVIPMIPQSRINTHHFDRLTPLLVADLQNYQATLGKANVKFMTRVNPSIDGKATEGFGLLYPNPIYEADNDGSSDAQPMTWYKDQPVAALLTTILKFTTVFDFDFVEPYVRNTKPAYQTASRIASLALLFLGICGVVGRLTSLIGNSIETGPAFFPALTLTGWAAVTMVTVPELRYALPMLQFLLLLTCALVGQLATRSWRMVILAGIATAVAVVALLSIADFARDSVAFR